MTNGDEAKPSCFVISEIGKRGSAERIRADKVFDHVIKPAAAEAGVAVPDRSDQLREPGKISAQIVKRLIEADLVVADLTGLNPNVFYELALRHAFRKPAIPLYSPDDGIPFDTYDLRSIPVSEDVEVALAARAELVDMMRAAIDDPETASKTPFTDGIDLVATLSAAKVSGDESLPLILEELAQLRTLVSRQRAPDISNLSGPPIFYDLPLDVGHRVVHAIKGDGVVEIADSQMPLPTDGSRRVFVRWRSGDTSIVPAEELGRSLVDDDL